MFNESILHLTLHMQHLIFNLLLVQMPTQVHVLVDMDEFVMLDSFVEKTTESFGWFW